MPAPAHTGLAIERRPLAALADIVAPWRALAATAAEPNVFYDPDFALAAAPVFGRAVETILLWDRPGSLIGLFPLTVARRCGMKIAVGWTHPFAPLGTPLIDRERGAAAIAGFLDHIARDDSLPRLVLLPYLNEGGPVAAMLAAVLARRGGAYEAFGRHRRAALMPATAHPPLILGTGAVGGDQAAYLRRAIGGKRRKELRRQRRRLAERGTVQISFARTPAEVAAALADFMTLEAAGWKGRAATAMAQRAEIARFVATAVGALAAREQALVARFYCGLQVVAAAIVLRSGRGAWGWKIAYDEDFAAASPGVQLYLDLTESLLADPTVAFVDSCAVHHHPMIDHIWRERLAIADWLLTPRPGAGFATAGAIEGVHRRALAWTRSVRERVAR